MTPDTPPPPSLDARISHTGRVAGVDHVLISNDWFSCPVEILPVVGRPVGRGYAWRARFQDLDTLLETILEGDGGTRSLATGAAIDGVTKHISAVTEQKRLTVFGTTALQPGVHVSLWERTRRFCTRSAIRIGSRT